MDAKCKDIDLANKLLDKSIEAFVMSLEIYNKPTIKYRIEGFSFFICNAWELMLKSKLLKDGKNIYYHDDRTYDLSKVISLIYTDKQQPLRINLEEIIDLRNTSTHFITEDYEIVYLPLFQVNINNFCDQIKRFHDINIINYVAQNFLTLSVNINMLNDTEINTTYTKEMAKKLISKRNEIRRLGKEINSVDFSIPISIEQYRTKDKSKADILYAYSKDASSAATEIVRLIDPQDKYPYAQNQIIKEINKKIKMLNLDFNYISSKGSKDFNQYTCKMIIDFYKIKADERYCFKFENVFRYNYQLIDFIIKLIEMDPNIISNIANKQKKITPGS